jgi:hypothetical protein
VPATTARGYTFVQCQQQIDHAVHLAGGISVRLTIWLIALAVRLSGNSLFVVFIYLSYKRLKQDQKVVADFQHSFPKRFFAISLKPLADVFSYTGPIKRKYNLCTKKLKKTHASVKIFLSHCATLHSHQL